MAEDPERPVPAGAAVFPLIPPELGVHPLLLATLHAIVFFDGSEEEVVNPAAADEALEYLVTYLERLEGNDMRRLQEDMACLQAFARQEHWPRAQQDFLNRFIEEYGVGYGTEAE